MLPCLCIKHCLFLDSADSALLVLGDIPVADNLLLGAGSASGLGPLHPVPTWLDRATGNTPATTVVMADPPVRLFRANDSQRIRSPVTIAEAKARIRREALRRRRLHAADGADETAQANQRLIDFLSRSGGARILAGYYAINSEIDPLAALVFAGECGMDVCLPVVVAAGMPLEFRRWNPGDRLVENAFGTSVPAARVVLDPDVLVVPMVAFDKAGYRLGYGGGFYDRTLQQLRYRAGHRGRSIVAVGFAYDAQEVPSVPRDANDQRLDVVITETQFLISEWEADEPDSDVRTATAIKA